MYKDYTTSVVQEYESKKALNVLSSRLAWPTPASLREECIDVYKERFHRRDYNTLRVFFRLNGDANTYINTIENFDIDKFRPLIKYLKGDIRNTDEKNIELLAWLIDFKWRPFDHDTDYTIKPPTRQEQIKEVQPTDNKSAGKVEEKAGAGRLLTSSQGKSGPWWKDRKYPGIALIVFIAMLGVAGYKVFQTRKPALLSSTYGPCMYWDKDRFRATSCNPKDPSIVTMDSARLLNFRKIMEPDTITYRSLGRIWYLKKNNKLEYFTQDGYHPIHRSPLKPISRHIIDTYILNE